MEDCSCGFALSFFKKERVEKWQKDEKMKDKD